MKKYKIMLYLSIGKIEFIKKEADSSYNAFNVVKLEVEKCLRKNTFYEIESYCRAINPNHIVKMELF